MQTPRLAACVVALGVASVCSAQVPDITATPSHTFTPTPTITPTPTSTPTNGPTTPLPTPWAVRGSDISINQTTPGNQHVPSVAIGANNGFVVAWTDDDLDGSGWGVFARRFNAAGVPLSADFLVNTSTTGDQQLASIASDNAGNFIVVWSSAPGSIDGSDPSAAKDVFARRYDSAGSALGGEFMVNTYTTGSQYEPDVAMEYTGKFVVVWKSSNQPQDADAGGIFGQLYDASGSPVNAEFQVNTYTTGEQGHAAVSMSGPGHFVVVWESAGQDGSGEGVFGQFFLDNGDPYLGEFQVNTHTTSDQSYPDVGANPGGFMAVWSSDGNDGSGSGIFGRIFGGSTLPTGDDFQINTYTTNSQLHPRVSPGGAYPLAQIYTVTWEGFGRDDPQSSGEPGVYAQRFSNAPFGTAAFFLANPPRRGSEYQVNSFTTGAQEHPAIATDPRGQFVIAWDSEDQDGSGIGVFAARFGFPDAQPMTVDTRASGGTSNVNGVLEPGERVTVDPSWRNTALTNLPLQGTLSNITGPPGPAYAIDDTSADYGSIVAFETNPCFSATGDCYEVTVSGTRPVQHWDATVDETLSPGPLLGGAPPRIKTWALHVGGSFADVPEVDPFYAFIENLFHNRVTAGGACGAGNYCGEDGVLRQQMAVFLLKSIYSADFVPPPASGTVFDDVPASNPFAPWIEELARENITAGCVAPPPPALPSFCPTAVVNRQQMAVFLLKTRFGAGFNPRPCSGIFDDVPCGPGFPAYIEELYDRGIAAGCSASPPLFCPTDPTKRKQMAPFLVTTFELQLYGSD